MANDWLPIRPDLREAPEVIAIAAATKLDADTVVGKLVRLWGWAGKHTATGRIESVTLVALNDIAGAQNFCESMAKVFWLEELEGGGVRFPDWKKHNAKCAKARLLASNRQLRKREKEKPKLSRALRDKSVTREEKRREENNTPPDGGVSPITPRAIYTAYPRHEAPGKAELAIGKAIAKLNARNQTEPTAWLLSRVKLYAECRAEIVRRDPSAEQYTPLPATWFNQERYDDDERLWKPGNIGTTKPKPHHAPAADRGEFAEAIVPPMLNFGSRGKPADRTSSDVEAKAG